MGAAHHAAGHRARSRRRLTICLVLVGSYMVAELIGGLLTGSLALLADAGHMLADAAALSLSLFAAWIAGRPPTKRRSWGYYRTEILAALANGSALLAIAVFIVLEAVERLGAARPVAGGAMSLVALGGLAVNLAALAILRGARNDSLNVRGAWLHVLGDTFGSIGAVVAGLLIWRFGWLWADPAASLIIAVLILVSAWGLVQESVAVLMEGTPAHLDPDEVREAILSQAGVAEVHDLHLWTITSGLVALSAHVVEDGTGDGRRLLAGLRDLLHDRFGIDHLTIQVEPEDFEERDSPI